MAGPFAILGLIASVVASNLFAHSNNYKKSIPETDPLPTDLPPDQGSKDYPSRSSMFQDLRRLFQSSYLVDYQKQQLAIFDQTNLERFEAKIREARDIAYDHPQAAADYDIPAIRAFAIMQAEKDPRMRYFYYLLQFRDEFDTHSLGQIISNELTLHLREGKIPVTRPSIVRLVGEEKAEPIFHQEAARLIRERTPPLNNKLLSKLENLSSAQLDVLVSLFVYSDTMEERLDSDLETTQLIDTLKMDKDTFLKSLESIQLHFILLAESRGHYPRDYLQRANSFNKESLIHPLEREMDKAGFTPDPFDDAQLFHRCHKLMSSEIKRFQELTVDQWNDSAYFNLLHSLHTCVFYALNHSPSRLAALHQQWRTEVTTIQQNKSFHLGKGLSDGVYATSMDSPMIAKTFAWSGAVEAPGIHPSIKLSEFLKKHITAIGVGKTKYGYEHGTVAPLLQLVFLDREQVADSSFYENVMAILHEAYHNYSSTERYHLNPKLSKHVLLEERNAYLFGALGLRLFENTSPSILIAEDKKFQEVVFASQLTVRAANVSLGFAEEDETLHHELPPQDDAEAKQTDPLLLVPEYLQNLGLKDQKEYISSKGQFTLKNPKK